MKELSHLVFAHPQQQAGKKGFERRGPDAAPLVAGRLIGGADWNRAICRRVALSRP
jgi:hypothetical protein